MRVRQGLPCHRPSFSPNLTPEKAAALAAAFPFHRSISAAPYTTLASVPNTITGPAT